MRIGQYRRVAFIPFTMYARMDQLHVHCERISLKVKQKSLVKQQNMSFTTLHQLCPCHRKITTKVKHQQTLQQKNSLMKLLF